MGYLLAILVEHGHTVAGQIDVPTVVDRHPVRPHVGKHLAVREGAVGLNVIFQDSIGLGLGHIQILSIGRAYKTIGLIER